MLRSKDPVRSQGPVAHAQLLEAGHAPAPAVVKRLRHGAGLHVSASKGSASTVTSLCSTLQDGSYYVASADGHSSEGASKLVQPHIPLQVYVLWPMLQSPPAWLLQDYENAKGAEVRVRRPTVGWVGNACNSGACQPFIVCCAGMSRPPLQQTAFTRDYHAIFSPIRVGSFICLLQSKTTPGLVPYLCSQATAWFC